MAIVMPFVGYGVYRALARNAPLTSRRRAIAAGFGGYVGINAAALCAAIQFGVQPSLFHTANGTPLYAPFHLSQTIPAMLLAHLTVAGVVEFALTAGIVTYLQRANLPLLRLNHRAVPETEADAGPPKRLGWRWGVIGLVVMAALTPLGLIAPGGAFGESSPDSLDLQKYHLNAVPSGLRDYAGFWHHALFNGYDFSHDKHPAVGYLISAAVGVVVIGIVVLAILALVRMAHSRRSGQDDAELDRVAA
jgi:cobalt/nickel transport system permease protein